MPKKKTQKEFIAEASLVHSNKYSYQNAIYINSQTKVIVTCPKHGDFKISPNHHLRGTGCVTCSYELRAKKATLSTEDFIKKAKKIHQNTYDYSKFTYTGRRNSSIIICKKHGEFKQCPDSHLNNQGCPKCGIEKSSEASRSSTKEFLTKSNKIHNNYYNYTEVEYINNHTKVVINCPEHGNFKQLPQDHIKGHGCPLCATAGFNKEKPAILYYINVDNKAYKIGITNRTIQERFTAEELKSIKIIKEYNFDKGINAYNVEQEILKHRTYFGYEGPKLLSSGNTELFSINILPVIESLMES